MSYTTMEVEIDHGKVVPKEPAKLPEKGSGYLTILQPADGESGERRRVKLPLIRGDGKRIINPTSEQLDASLWGN